MKAGFVLCEHNRSLKGSLAAYAKISIPPDEEWSAIKDKAWELAIRERWARSDYIDRSQQIDREPNEHT